MKNGNRGPIGLPLRRVQSRNALVMSAIQEERASAMSAIAVAIEPSDSCSSSPTTSSSSPDSSPHRQQVASSHLKSVNSDLLSGAQKTTQADISSQERSQKLEEVKSSSPIPPTHAPPRIVRTQSARLRSAQRLADVPLAGVKGLKTAMAKQMQSISARSRSIPYFNDANTATNASRTTSQSTSSGRSRSPFRFDDSLMNDEHMPTEPISAKIKTKGFNSERSRPTPRFDDSTSYEEAMKNGNTAKSLRSRPVPRFDDGLHAPGSVPQREAKDWKVHATRTRPASSPTSQNLTSPTSSNDVKNLARRRNSNPTAPLELAKSNSPTIVSGASLKHANQYRSHRLFPSEENASVYRPRASSDGGLGFELTNQLSNQNIRPRALSDSKPTQKEIKLSSRLRHYEGKFQNRRGQSLLYFSLFPPEKLAMRGIILHLHGLGDHCRRNTALYERYCEEGFGVIAYDLLNHGASDYDKYKVRAHISNFNELIDDTNDFITFAKTNIYKVALRYWRKHHHPIHPHGKEKKRESLPELPLIITGNSLGSLIGLHTILSGKQKFHAAVWASPSIGVTWTPVLWAQWKFAKALLAAFPTAKMIPAVQHSLRSRNPHFLVRYQKDPLTCSEMITPRTGYEIVCAMSRLQQDARVSDEGTPFCSIPMLFLAGTNDRISDQQASLKFFSRMGSFDKEFQLFEGLYHMIYDEPEQEDVLKYMINWLHKRFPLETRQS
ncbi:serine protease family [Plasmopara halstedii]|uniref:Serine protease family n=1 Tax=Plasmopara halstedii TaxID=4781 RepID=A0A0P1A609_PLAHL|nr:serine protease family [Plasmopara halstedii]CEG35458.1 serine protease family [Plasmopara halstedii]|eukprot:XP_024571827.1 serine protease family [Plasmopara halstedii]